MRKLLTLVVVVVVILSMVVVGCTKPAPEPEEISLTAATFFPAVSAQSKMMEAFLQELEKESAGRIKSTYYPGQTLLKGDKLYEGAATGIADIVMAPLHYTPGRFPTADALYKPLGIPSGWVATHVANDFVAKFEPEEFKDTHTLFFHASAPLVVYTKKPVRTTDDLEGMTLRCTSPNNSVISALGAVPNNMGMPDVYESVSKGLLDGVFIGADGFTVWRLGDVVEYTTFPMVGGSDVFVLTMNNDTWSKLPSDIQKIFTDVSADYVEVTCKMWTDVNRASYDLGKEQGIEYISLSPSEKARWEQALANVIDSYVDERVAAGESKTDVEEWINYIKDRIEYWRQEQVKAGIEFLG